MGFLEPFIKSCQTKSNVSKANDERVSDEILHETESFKDEDPPQFQMERQSVAPFHQEEKEEEEEERRSKQINRASSQLPKNKYRKVSDQLLSLQDVNRSAMENFSAKTDSGKI